MTAASKTAFHEELVKSGANFVEWNGWDWVTDCGDVPGEYWATRRGVGLWDQPALPKWRFRGPGAVPVADRLSTNDMSGLKPGRSKYSPYCDTRGMMISDLVVFVWSPDEVWVMPTLEFEADHLDEAVEGLEVEFERVTDDYADLQLMGPKSVDVLAQVCDADVRALEYFELIPRQVRVGGAPCFVSRTAYSGERGYEIFCEPVVGARIWRALMDTGEVRPFGLTALEPHRIESALLFVGRDYQPRGSSPYEVRLDRLVALDRDFIGRDALMAVGPSPERRLETVTVAGDVVPELGATVRAGGEEVGVLTSACHSPWLDGVVGLAMLDVERPDGELEIACGGSWEVLAVAPHPIVNRRRERALVNRS